MILTLKVKRGIWRFYGGLFFIFFVIFTGTPIAIACGMFSTQFVWNMLWVAVLLMITAVIPLPFFLLETLVKKLRDEKID